MRFTKKMIDWKFFILGFASILAPTHSAIAQSVTCLPRTALVQSLKSTHGEHLTGGGLQNALHVIEVWSSVKSGSFTVFVTRADGMACIVATGQNWHNNLPPTTTDKEGEKG